MTAPVFIYTSEPWAARSFGRPIFAPAFTRERMSNCIVGSGGSRLPCSTIAEHSVEGCDHFSHDGDDDDLGFFVGGGEAFVEGFEGGDVILATGSPVVRALQQATGSVPIVFTQVPDPVSDGFVETLARPGGNANGFTTFEYGMSAKWLELLKEIAPRVTRAAILRDLGIAAGSGQLGAIQAVAPSLGMELSPVGLRDAGEVERAVTAFARGSNGGLIVTGSTAAVVHRELIIMLAARYRLPAVYPFRYYVNSGGLSSYGPETI